ncbi:hypothetical protein JX266_001108 [Neoarthrinium moseri]|nr:hypothetical protein JX266_001108 [Neoarthrinium moseri]
MDPLSITTSCLALLGALTQTTTTIIQFIRDCREARGDLTSVTQELSDLRIVLELLKEDAAEADGDIPLSAALRTQIITVINNCGDVAAKIERVLVNLRDSRVGAVRWVLDGKKQVFILKQSLEAHRGALSLALEMVHLSVTKAVKEDTGAIREDTKEIKQDTAQILEEIARLRERIPIADRSFVLERYLDSLSTYAATVYDGVNGPEGGSLHSTDHSSSAEGLSDDFDLPVKGVADEALTPRVDQREKTHLATSPMPLQNTPSGSSFRGRQSPPVRNTDDQYSQQQNNRDEHQTRVFDSRKQPERKSSGQKSLSSTDNDKASARELSLSQKLGESEYRKDIPQISLDEASSRWTTLQKTNGTQDSVTPRKEFNQNDLSEHFQDTFFPQETFPAASPSTEALETWSEDPISTAKLEIRDLKWTPTGVNQIVSFGFSEKYNLGAFVQLHRRVSIWNMDQGIKVGEIKRKWRGIERPSGVSAIQHKELSGEVGYYVMIHSASTWRLCENIIISITKGGDFHIAFPSITDRFARQKVEVSLAKLSKAVDTSRLISFAVGDGGVSIAFLGKSRYCYIGRLNRYSLSSPVRDVSRGFYLSQIGQSDSILDMAVDYAAERVVTIWRRSNSGELSQGASRTILVNVWYRTYQSTGITGMSYTFSVPHWGVLDLTYQLMLKEDFVFLLSKKLDYCQVLDLGAHSRQVCSNTDGDFPIQSFRPFNNVENGLLVPQHPRITWKSAQVNSAQNTVSMGAYYWNSGSCVEVKAYVNTLRWQPLAEYGAANA